MKVIQHIPTYMDGCERSSSDVSTLAELLALPWVKWWEDHNLRIVDGAAVRPLFVGWRRSSGSLLALYGEDESEWHVVAHAPDAILAGLPEWRISPAGQAKVDRWNRGDTR